MRTAACEQAAHDAGGDDGAYHSHPVKGPDFDAMMHCTAEVALGMTLSAFHTTGLQATQMGRARELVQRALKARRLQQQQQHEEEQQRCEQDEREVATGQYSCLPRHGMPCCCSCSCPSDKIFLAYTSNLISSGLRDTFAYLARHHLIDAIVTTAGGVEEDVIKCLGPTLVGDFHLDGKELRRRGINRVGNVLVPNNNYCLFEDFFTPVLADLHASQRESGWRVKTAPSDYIAAMGAALDRRRARFATCLHKIQSLKKEQSTSLPPHECKQDEGDMTHTTAKCTDRHGCENSSSSSAAATSGVVVHAHSSEDHCPARESNHPDAISGSVTEAECVDEISRVESSVVYWCYKHDIPIYSPALTDGSIGDMIYFYNFGKKGLVVDPVRDVCALRALADTSKCLCLCASCAKKSAGVTRRAARHHALVLGGGLPKHHLLSHVTVDTAIVISTGLEADGCSSSCCLVDDRACGLLRKEKSVEVARVQGDAAFVFPLLLVEEMKTASARPDECAQ